MDNTIRYRGAHEYKTYTSEFKTEALALICEQGYSIQEAASALDITTSLLYSWKNKAEEQANSTVNSDEQSELLALCKEVKFRYIRAYRSKYP